MSVSEESKILEKHNTDYKEELACNSLAERSSSLRIRTWRITKKVPTPSKAKSKRR